MFIGELIESARDIQAEWLASSRKLATGENNKYSTSKLVDENGNSIKEIDRGPIAPDHLREALRRTKKDKEGGLVGFQGLSFSGKEPVACRNNGRRLFR